MSDMSHLYRAYAAVHDTEVNKELSESKDAISEMDLTQLTESDLVLVAEEIIAGFFKEGYQASGVHELIAQTLEESCGSGDSPLRKTKITRLSEAFDKAFDKVYDKAVDVCEEAFLQYIDNKPLVEKWQGKVSHEHGNSKIHEACVAQDRKVVLEGLRKMLEGTMDIKGFEIPKKEREAAADRIKKKTLNIRGNDSAEQKARLEKKRGMKLDDHPQFKEENILGVPSKIRTEWAEAYRGIYEGKKGDGNLANNYPPYDKVTRGDIIAGAKGEDQMGGKKKKDVKEARNPGESMQDYADRMKKKHSGGKAKVYDPMKDKTFDHDEAEKTRGQSGKFSKEELDTIAQSMIDEGHDLSDYTWETFHTLCVEASMVDEGLIDAAKAGSERHQAAMKSASRAIKKAGIRTKKLGKALKPAADTARSAAGGVAKAAKSTYEAGQKTGKFVKKGAQRHSDMVKAAKKVFSKEELERIEAIVNSWDEGYQRNPEEGERKEREANKKYAPVRGEKTPMPPRGDKRREDFEKWYRQNVR